MTPREPTDKSSLPEHPPLVDAQGRPSPSTSPPKRRSSRKVFWEGIRDEYGPRWIRRIPRPFRWIAFVLFVSISLACNYSDHWWPWVQQQYRHLVPSPQLPLPKAKQFAIAIARLEEDTNDELRDLLVEGLRGLPGVQVLRFNRATGLRVASDPREEEFRIQRQAQGWLQESQADLILWGQVLPATAGKERMVRLFFTGRDTDHQETLRLEAGQAIELPVAARAPLEAMVRTQVLARLDGFSDSQPVARALRTEIDRLQAMVRDWPVGQSRFFLHLALADAWQTVGNQMGEDASLKKAIKAYQEALAGAPRATEPVHWALTQNNLGNALRILGERESGTTRLQESVVAYRLALEEWTRERVPLDWARPRTTSAMRLRYWASTRAGRPICRSR